MAPGLNLPPSTAAAAGQAGPSVTKSTKATVEDVDDVTASSSSASTSRFATGGIILPPPEVAQTIDKTAALFAKKDAAFEERIKRDERTNAKLAFLHDHDPYHAYYKAKVEALRHGTGPLANASASASSDVASGPGAGQIMRVDGQEAMDDERERQDAARPIEPPPQLFIADLPNISAVDLDIIKLTALFVAKRGKAFSNDLLAKEGNNSQFQFMRPQHSLFGLYSRIVEQYRTVLHPPTELMDSLQISAGERSQKLGIGRGGARQHVLQQARQRAEWEKWVEQKRKEKASQEEEERAAFAEIDWQDFVVVATVEITETDQHIDLPVPMSLREVENMTMAQKRMAAMIEEEEGADEQEALASVGIVDLPGPEAARAKEASAAPADDEMQMDSDSEGEQQQDTKPAAAAPPPTMKIRKDYVPKTLAERQRQQQSSTSTTKCPVCGETVPTNEMEEHVRIELLNPKYREQRADLEARRAQQATLTTGADPSRFLKQFAGARTDIFGRQDQEMSAAKREEEERRKAKEREKVIWDGHAASRDRTREGFNRPDMVENTMRDIQGRFKPNDTESIGPQIGDKRPAGEDGAAPPAQRPAYEGQGGQPYAGPPPAQPQQQYPPHMMMQQPPQQQYYQQQQQQQAPAAYGVAPPHASGYNSPYQGGPPPAQPPSNTTMTLQLQLPDAQTVTYGSLEPSSTIASIRDRIQAERFATVGASRIKLKCVRTGKMLNLKQTLQSAGLLENGEVIEVSVK